MKVLVLTNMYPSPQEPWRGSFVAEQVTALEAEGIDCDVLSFDGRRDRLEYLRAVRRLRRRLKEERYDLMHAHYGLSGAVALLARSRLPTVTTFWGSDTGYVRWQGWVSRVVARRTTPIFVACENAKRLGLSEAVVIPSAVDLTLFQPRDQRVARRELDWPLDAPIALFPGARANRVKRADLFERALALARVQAPRLVGMVLEGMSRKQVLSAMNAADVLLMTSDSEGSPLAVKEALACMTPVVAVPVGDVPETIGGLPGCSVVPRDPKALADALLAALHSGRPAELRARAERYSSTRIAQEVIAVYERVVSTGHDGTAQ